MPIGISLVSPVEPFPLVLISEATDGGSELGWTEAAAAPVADTGANLANFVSKASFKGEDSLKLKLVAEASTMAVPGGVVLLRSFSEASLEDDSILVSSLSASGSAVTIEEGHTSK